MSYRKTDYGLGALLASWIMLFAIVFVVFYTPIYYWCIEQLNISFYTSLSTEQIKINYQCMIDYFYLFNRNSLEFTDFSMSVNGRIHFEDVKVIIDWIQVLFMITSLSCIVLIYKQQQKKEYRYLKVASILILVILISLFLISMIDFSYAFVLFHKLLFRNEYWIFSVISDPVITILPEGFFLVAFICMVLIAISISLLCFWFYKSKEKKIIISS